MNIQFLSSSMDSTTMSNISMIVMLVIMFAVMYFLLYRPQKKQQKKDAEMRNSLEIGDEVTTIGGIVGRVILRAGDRQRPHQDPFPPRRRAGRDQAGYGDSCPEVISSD